MVEVNVLDVVKISFYMLHIDWYYSSYMMKLTENYAKKRFKLFFIQTIIMFYVTHFSHLRCRLVYQNKVKSFRTIIEI